MYGTVFKHCVKFEPRERPAMVDVVRRLGKIIEDANATNEALIKKSGPTKLTQASMARRLGNITENANDTNAKHYWRCGH